jgi:AcrR family transcriptional regulator
MHATGMREVAAEAGVSLRLVQYYFGTKEELLLSGMQQLAVRFGERAMTRIRRVKETGPLAASPQDRPLARSSAGRRLGPFAVVIGSQPVQRDGGRPGLLGRAELLTGERLEILAELPRGYELAE